MTNDVSNDPQIFVAFIFGSIFGAVVTYYTLDDMRKKGEAIKKKTMIKAT